MKENIAIAGPGYPETPFPSNQTETNIPMYSPPLTNGTVEQPGIILREYRFQGNLSRDVSTPLGLVSQFLEQCALCPASRWTTYQTSHTGWQSSELSFINLKFCPRHEGLKPELDLTLRALYAAKAPDLIQSLTRDGVTGPHPAPGRCVVCAIKLDCLSGCANRPCCIHAVRTDRYSVYSSILQTRELGYCPEHVHLKDEMDAILLLAFKRDAAELTAAVAARVAAQEAVARDVA